MRRVTLRRRRPYLQCWRCENPRGRRQLILCLYFIDQRWRRRVNEGGIDVYIIVILQFAHQPLNTIQVRQKPRVPCVKLAHPSETFRVRPVEEVLCYIRPPIHDQARKPRVGVIQPVKYSIRLFHNRNASEVNTFVEPVGIHTTPPRAKRIPTF